MKRKDIESSELGKALSNFSNSQRHTAINQHRSKIEGSFNVKIEERHFTELNSIPSDWFYFSCTDSSRNYSYIAVFKPL